MSYDLEVYAARRPAVPDGAEVDGPFEAEDEDAPPEVAAALLAVRWLVQLTGKESLAAAKAIAESGRGVVYDPQKGAIVRLAWIGEVYGGPALTRTSVRPDKPRRIAWPSEYVRNGDEPAAVIPDLSAA